MEAAIENCKSLGVSPLIYKYELANCYCMKMKWDIAASHFEPLVEAEKFQVRALCALQLAGCYYLAGHREKAHALFLRVPSLIKKNSSVDPIVAHQAQRYLAAGGHFCAFEMLYIRRDLAKMEKEIPQLLPLLEQLATEVGANVPISADSNKGSFLSSKFKSLSLGGKSKTEVVDHSADNRASYLMIKGAMLRTLNRGDEAITCYREVIQMDNTLREKFFVPYSLYELAEALYHNNNLKEAQEVIKKCNNISGYSWEDPLKVRLRVTMDQLKHGGVIDDGEEEGGQSSTVTVLIASDGAEHPYPSSSSSNDMSSTPAPPATATPTPAPTPNHPTPDGKDDVPATVITNPPLIQASS
jgi:tetratricopeptide (TPR) repeat protein